MNTQDGHTQAQAQAKLMAKCFAVLMTALAVCIAFSNS